MKDRDGSVAGEFGWRTLIVDHRGAGWRVDAYLARRFPACSRTQIAQALQRGEVTSTQRALKPSSCLALGEELHVTIPSIAPSSPPPPLPEVLYEDELILALDKPAGLLAHPTGAHFEYGVIGLARSARPGTRMDLAHRLDRETSGVLVLTKSAHAATLLKTAFQRRAVHKEYLALVRGHPTWTHTEIDAPLGSREDSRIRIRQGVRSDGAPATTRVRTLERLSHGVPLSLVRCEPLHGRTHQLRVHLEHVGHPLLGDKMYGQPDHVFLHLLDHGPDEQVRSATSFPRQALHAHRLVLPHPDGTSLEILAPLAPDMRSILDGESPCWPLSGE